MQPRPDFARYAVQHPDGRYLYHLTGTNQWGFNKEILADGQPMTRLGSSSWWSTDHEAERITLITPGRPTVTGYELRDTDALSVRYPATLTPDEWNDRLADADSTDVEMTLHRLYHAVTTDTDPVETHDDGPFTVIGAGELPAADGPTWTVNLIDQITQRPEYARLFPGRLDGLRQHLMDVIKRMPRVQHVLNDFQSRPGVYVSLRVPFEQPEAVWRPDISNRTGKTLKTGRHHQVLVDHTLTLPIPYSIGADNYETARAEWDRQVEYWTGVVAAANVVACNHCGGSGYLGDSPDQYRTPR
ncbi:hypothetical protein OG896_24895 [Streptomyces sp. NBC_00669]|uniref:hypothetical protein n=1 Tax=Streptomyces sp. NBC_00669 TaxID=2976011 RepID=UPI002E34AE08|nr:hypothetical protein [Streptomyces sp. NBC_00669]